MSATIIPFPGVDTANIRPRPTCVADLPEGTRALVAIIADQGRFAVVIRPALTTDERRARKTFRTAREALQFARDTAISAPRRFPLILDETGRQPLDHILGGAA